MTQSWLRCKLVPRYCASAVNNITIRWQLTCSLLALYRDTRIRQKICTMTPKTAPCFVHSSWYQDSTPMTLNCSSLHSLSNTNALYCRAVTGNCAKTTWLFSLDKLLIHKYLVNSRLFTVIQKEIENRNDIRLAPKSTSPAIPTRRKPFFSAPMTFITRRN